MNIDPAYKKLLDCGIRPSIQRIEILRYLMDHHTHPTIDELFTNLKKTYTYCKPDNYIQYIENVF